MNQSSSGESTPQAVPAPYAQDAVVTAIGGISVPVLGGFSLAAAIQTLTLKPDDLRWLDATLLLFFLAAVLFIIALQATWWARTYRTNTEHFDAWAEGARGICNLGLLILLAGLTTLMVPAPTHGHVPVLRWVAVVVGVVAFIVEAVWIVLLTKRTSRACKGSSEADSSRIKRS
jgi:hypothetical protein